MNADLLLPQGGELWLARVFQQSVNFDGKFIGKHNDIPIL